MKASVLAIGIAAAASISFGLGRSTTGQVDAATYSPGEHHVQDSGRQVFSLTRVKPSARLATETVQGTSRALTIRTQGTVKADQRKVYTVVAGAPGRLTSLGDNYPGTIVHKDQLLASFFSNQFVKVEQAYFFALDAQKRDQASGVDGDALRTDQAVRSQEGTLISMGMGEAQLRQLAQTRKATRDIAIVSPADGMVVARSLFPAQQLEEDQEMYRIVGLDSVWVFAAVTPAEMAAIPPGTRARVLVKKMGRIDDAVVRSSVSLTDDAGPRLQLKLEVVNKELLLRPDMPVEVEFQLPASAQITVPISAVLDSGLKRTVFVESGEGIYQQRVVDTGRRIEDRVVVHGGLKEQDKVVVSANYLVDSESRLRGH